MEVDQDINLPNIDLPIVLEEQIGKNESQIWFITYGKELQGLVITDREIEFPYYDIHTALLNIFLNVSHAILILEGYMMEQMNDFFFFDSHARIFLSSDFATSKFLSTFRQYIHCQNLLLCHVNMLII